jgi:hypothetical protein
MMALLPISSLFCYAHLAGEHWIQSAGAFQIVQFITATDMLTTDPNLWHRSTSRRLGHFLPRRGIEVDGDLSIANPLLLEQ